MNEIEEKIINLEIERELKFKTITSIQKELEQGTSEIKDEVFESILAKEDISYIENQVKEIRGNLISFPEDEEKINLLSKKIEEQKLLDEIIEINYKLIELNQRKNNLDTKKDSDIEKDLDVNVKKLKEPQKLIAEQENQKNLKSTATEKNEIELKLSKLKASKELIESQFNILKKQIDKSKEKNLPENRVKDLEKTISKAKRNRKLGITAAIAGAILAVIFPPLGALALIAIAGGAYTAYQQKIKTKNTEKSLETLKQNILKKDEIDLKGIENSLSQIDKEINEETKNLKTLKDKNKKNEREIERYAKELYESKINSKKQEKLEINNQITLVKEAKLGNLKKEKIRIEDSLINLKYPSDSLMKKYHEKIQKAENKLNEINLQINDLEKNGLGLSSPSNTEKLCKSEINSEQLNFDRVKGIDFNNLPRYESSNKMINDAEGQENSRPKNN